MAYPAPVADERELFVSWLRSLRESVLRKVDGLDDAQARWRPDGCLIPLAGIVNHLIRVEWRWIDGSYGGAEVSRSEDEFLVPHSVPLAELIAAYRRRGDRTDRIVRGADLTSACQHPSYPGLTLRWVLLHLIEETARHAGHADATRELLDGATGL